MRYTLNVTKLKNIKEYFLAIYLHVIQFVVVKLAEITHFSRGTAYRWSAWLSCRWIMCSLLFRCMIASNTKVLLFLSEMTAPSNRWLCCPNCTETHEYSQDKCKWLSLAFSENESQRMNHFTKAWVCNSPSTDALNLNQKPPPRWSEFKKVY